MVQKVAVGQRSVFAKNTNAKTMFTDYNRTLVGSRKLTSGMLANTREHSVVRSMYKLNVALLRNNSGAHLPLSQASMKTIPTVMLFCNPCKVNPP